MSHLRTLCLLLCICGLAIAASEEGSEHAAHNAAVQLVIEHHDLVPPAVVAALQADRLREYRHYQEQLSNKGLGPVVTAVIEEEVEDAPSPAREIRSLRHEVTDLQRQLERAQAELAKLQEEQRQLRSERHRLQRRLSSTLKTVATQQRTIDKLTTGR